jgi:UDP-N-acetylglucosamine--N-acetylmuramyl-(pentapeptide) pyrophosphoryl-undecaprenol N-acetylglucosamine transferase
VIGTGGYVSLPVLKMASLRHIPTVLQEQNSYPGIATRRLAGSARRVYLGFKEATRFLPGGTSILVTGNPVRRSITGGDRSEALRRLRLDPSRKTILVLGGSQGARPVNQAVLKSLQGGALSKEYQLLWLTGKRDYKEVVATAGKDSHDHSLFPFESRMELVYAAADVAIARAGAITLAELEACRLPAIVIPFPHAAGDHQRHNARAYAERGIAEMIDQNDLNRVDILARAVSLIENGRAEQMRQAIIQQTAGRKPAVDVIAEDIIKLAGLTQEATIEG